MASGTTTAFMSWLSANSTGHTVHENNSPDDAHFTIDHANSSQVTRSQMMAQLINADLWILSRGINSGSKEYKIGNIKPTW